jgi:small subunit ribosomal protein S16
MALKIRLRRMGRRNAPTYRIVVAEALAPRDGRLTDSIGHYNPRTEPATLVVDRARALHWIERGATPTETVKSLLKKAGVFRPEEPGAVSSAASAVVGAAKGAAQAVAGAVKGAASAAAGAVRGGGDEAAEAVEEKPAAPASEATEAPAAEATGTPGAEATATPAAEATATPAAEATATPAAEATSAGEETPAPAAEGSADAGAEAPAEEQNA